MAKNAMRAWLDAATPAEIDKVTTISKITLGTMRQIAGGYRTEGQARTTPDTAIALEEAAGHCKRPGLPVLRREDLCPACAGCSFAKQARKNNKKVA